MRRIRFILVADHPQSDQFNWKRFFAGAISAVAFVLLGTTVVGAVQQRRSVDQVEALPSATTEITTTISLSSPTASQTVLLPTPTPTLTFTPTSLPPSPTTASYPPPNENIITTTATLPGMSESPTISPTTSQQLPVNPFGPPQEMPTATHTPEAEPTATIQLTPTLTVADAGEMAEPTPTATPTESSATNTDNTDTPPTDTPRPTDTPTEAAEPTDTPEPTTEPTTEPTDTPQPTDTVRPTNTIKPTDTPSPTHTPEGKTAIPTPFPTAEDIAIFGAEINDGRVEGVVEKAEDSGITWVRYNGLIWHEIQDEEDGEYEWPEDVEEDLRLIQERGFEPLVIIRGTPEWAKSDDVDKDVSKCGPIHKDHLDDFAEFVKWTVERYSQSPYSVKYWEIGNEPDVDPSLLTQPMPYGCWGDQSDEYYGGEYFAEMLRKIYPVIKDADPNAKVVLGGLLLDCDPNDPPEDKNRESCKPSRFLEGILKNGGGSAFDILAYHGYAFWELGTNDWDLEHRSWKHRGGALLGKREFIKEVLEDYDLEKPLMANEIGLLCWISNSESSKYCTDNGFLEAQANYAVRTYIRAWVNDIYAAIWYTFNHSGWNEAGLLTTGNEPRPAYYTIEFLTELLDEATYKEEWEDATTRREGYIFEDDEYTYSFYWSNDDSTFDIDLPDGEFTLYDDVGEEIDIEDETTDETTYEVGFDPVIIQERK